MKRSSWDLGVSAALAMVMAVHSAAPLGAQGRDPSLEAALTKGITLVEDGDYSSAIVVLDDVVARLGRLQEQKARVARAHLYLAIAYVGEGQESLAAASFREALRYDPELTLNPTQFSPKVRERFQRVKNEVAAEKAAEKAGGTAASPRASATPTKGGSKTLVLGGVGAAGAGGVALAAGGGGGSGSDSPTTTTPAPFSEIALLSVTPPAGGAVSLGDGGEVIRVVMSVTHTTAGRYRVFAADLHPGGTGRECVCGVSDSLTLVPGQRQTTTVGLRLPCLGGQPSCPSLPFASTGLAVFLYTDDPAETIVIPEQAFPVSHTFTR
jgi:hypothetical protein